jgi:putative effector of murein hydrolase LrgA (UPF0299 family)
MRVIGSVVAISEKTKINLPASVAGGLLLAWLLYLTQITFQIKEDVAVIKATVVNSTKIAGIP